MGGIKMTKKEVDEKRIALESERIKLQNKDLLKKIKMLESNL